MAELGGAVVGQHRRAEIAKRFQGNSHAEISVGVARVAGDGALKCAYRVCNATDLEQSEAEVVLDEGVGRLEERRFPQWTDGVGRSLVLQKPGRQGKQLPDLPRAGWVGGQTHDANLPWDKVVIGSAGASFPRPCPCAHDSFVSGGSSRPCRPPLFVPETRLRILAATGEAAHFLALAARMWLGKAAPSDFLAQTRGALGRAQERQDGRVPVPSIGRGAEVALDAPRRAETLS